jgi:nicotinamidase-related amidase
MICFAKPASYRQIVIDVDTQSHFFCRHGSLCIRNHRGVLSNIQKVMHWAQTHHIPIISTLQQHNSHSTCASESDRCRLSMGKATCTLSENHLFVPAEDTLDWSISTFEHYDQIVIQKRCFDPFEEPRVDRIFTELPVDEYILIGTPLEGAVKTTALGLLLRQKKITLVTNAVGTLDPYEAQKMLNLMDAKAVRLIKANALVRSEKSAPAMTQH